MKVSCDKKNISFAGFSLRLLLGLVLGCCSGFGTAQEYMTPREDVKNLPGILVSDPKLTREDNNVMEVNMNITFPNLKINTNGAMVITPMIVNNLDTLRLPAIGIYGRTAWYASKRNDRLPISRGVEMVKRYEKKLADIPYSQKVKYEDWMNGSDLVVELSDYGCAGCDKGHSWLDPLAHYEKITFNPTFIYQTAMVQQIKTRELSGRAYVDFPVNKIEIYPDYRRNTEELRKILATIDSVRNDKDISVTSISIKGFASPEGSYSNNSRLAKGRTEALKNYVQGLYNFPQGFIKTSFEPEDWEGLREYVENSTMENKAGLLAIINDPYLEPDPRDKALSSRYPREYKFLLENVYPGLRHSDYKIEYVVRSFTDPVEIREILAKEPGKLSLNEIYLAAQGLEPGSDEYNEIFETAARLFPGEPVANLNAANSMMRRGDLVGAARYLERAGDSPEAIYARGVLAALNGDYNTAIPLIEKAVKLGVSDDQNILKDLYNAAKYSN